MIITELIFYILLIIFIIILSGLPAYGTMMSKEDEKRIEMKLKNRNAVYSKHTINWFAGDFATKSFTFISRWYIHEHGRQRQVWIFSPLNKLLDERLKELKSIPINEIRLTPN